MKYTRLKAACYTANVTMSAVGNLSPLLFVTFRELYCISYSLLGLLVLINFCTQLCVDLIFSFFSRHFNIPLTVRLTPVLSFVGLILFSLSPVLFPDSVYLGLVIGTVVFSAASGLAEVLISPVIAAIPSEHPDRDMSRLHAVYAWGVVAVVIISTLFLRFVGRTYWQWLPVIFALIPATSCLLFCTTTVPDIQTDAEKVGGSLKTLLRQGVLCFVVCIFLGGAAECTMSQWSSSYLENSLGIEKVYGDILGVAMFAVMLGLGRSLYAKFGKRIERVLLLGMSGAVICYITAALTPLPIVGLVACGLTGLCTSMLWPGSLIFASDKLPECGVTVFALMAAGGDLGASAAPQLVGLITDRVMENDFFARIAGDLGLGIEQLAMKTGLLFSTLFPIAGIIAVCLVRRRFRNIAAK